ncbi:hypothetical protein FKM82_012343 [Ascaphus truei]
MDTHISIRENGGTGSAVYKKPMDSKKYFNRTNLKFEISNLQPTHTYVPMRILEKKICPLCTFFIQQGHCTRLTEKENLL